MRNFHSRALALAQQEGTPKEVRQFIVSIMMAMNSFSLAVLERLILRTVLLGLSVNHRLHLYFDEERKWVCQLRSVLH